MSIINFYLFRNSSKLYNYCKISIAVRLDQTSIYKRNYNPKITTEREYFHFLKDGNTSPNKDVLNR